MKLNPKRPARPLARYVGGKNRLASKIVKLIPTLHDTYCEPYVGMGAVLFAKERSGIEAVNDLNDNLLQMMEILRTRTDDFVHAVKWTPYAHKEWALSFEPTDDPLERARRTYVRLWFSIYLYGPHPSFRRQMVFSRGRDGTVSTTSAAKSFMQVDHLFVIAERLRGVTLESMEALEFIKKYDYKRAFFYIDPPYLLDTRSNKRSNAYLYEMKDDASHRELAGVLNGLDGMAIISGYACPLYDEELYPDWRRVDFSSRTDGNGTAVESLWISPRTWDALEKERAEAEREALPLLAMMQ